jgi:hypothetical protein
MTSVTVESARDDSNRCVIELKPKAARYIALWTSPYCLKEIFVLTNVFPFRLQTGYPGEHTDRKTEWTLPYLKKKKLKVSQNTVVIFCVSLDVGDIASSYMAFSIFA